MKKFLSGTIAIVFAVAAAFATTPRPTEPRPVDPSFYWFNTASTPVYDGFRPKVDEMAVSGCQDIVTTICRNGYVQSDLKDPSHPELGVKSTAIPDATVRKTS